MILNDSHEREVPPMPQYEKGQGMVEYIVILAALTTALIAAGNGSVGFSKDDDDSLVQALHERYTAQAYAISISEIPEGRDLVELADYYNELGKYPSLSSKLDSAGSTLNKVSGGLAIIDQGISNLEKYTDPKEALGLVDTDAIKNEIKDQIKDAVNPF